MSNWSGIYGQEHVKDLLDKLLNSNKIPHALLFSGNEGTGKFLSAIRFTQNLNSHSSSIVKSISDLNEPYIKYIFPLPRGKNETEDTLPYEKLSSEEMQTVQEQLELKRNNPYYQIQIPKANFVKISSIRDIKKFLTFNYADVKYRTIIISDAHLMNEEAQNALLKNLEEPPEGIIFILSTPYPALLRETIRSRCWQVNFHPLKPEDIKTVLVEYFSIDPASAEITSLFANGSVISALKLLDNDLGSLLEKTISFLRYSFGRKINSAMKQLTDIIEENDPEIFKLLIQLVITWLNDVQKYRAGIRELAFRKHIDTIEKFSTKFPEADIVSTAASLEYFVSLLKNNVNINILLLNTVYALQNLTSRKTYPE